MAERLTIKDVSRELERVKKDVSGHEVWINGNGREGAKSQMAVFGERLVRVERLLYTAIVAVIVDVILTLWK